MKVLTYSEVLKTNDAIVCGREGWVKGKCLDKKCGAVIYWNAKSTGVKVSDNKAVCSICGGPLKRTTTDYSAKCVITDHPLRKGIEGVKVESSPMNKRIEDTDNSKVIDGMTLKEFTDYLETTLIPDLKESGYTSTAKDFGSAVKWINHLKKQ